ncbi:hypothetical protein KIN20_027084 [Parelaphostrongylus tenuis]|uniref:Uncharacterized protein n=1 Tax=Parelaphostrongylus tenuis TaxID=148309 RepID=A0AAD5WDK1_PARTN|nr:hypothetical protein KIN20_027084 [Parelaphostrongylus tenuis]
MRIFVAVQQSTAMEFRAENGDTMCRMHASNGPTTMAAVERLELTCSAACLSSLLDMPLSLLHVSCSLSS